MIDDNENKDADSAPDKSFDYRGSIVLTIAWLIWSVLGFIYLVFFTDKQNYLMELVYVASAILSVNSLNNRKYGFNNTIRFYKDYVVLPKVLGSWSWREEKIKYSDIDEVNFIDYGNNISKNYFEIEVKTELYSYPIFGKKLEIEEIKEVYEYLCNKAKVRCINFTESFDVNNNSEDVDISSNNNQKWKGYLALVALIVSGWTIIGISLSTPYSNLVSGGRIFLISFIASVFFTFTLSKKIKNESEGEEKLKKWQRVFLLGYIGLYGGIALTFSLVYLNGKFDSSITENLSMSIVSTDTVDSKKGPCFHLKVDPQGRSPSSIESSIMNYGDVHICSKALRGAKVGDHYLLKAKSGLLYEKWIIDVAKLK